MCFGRAIHNGIGHLLAANAACMAAGWVQELYLHQHDAATITAPHSTKFLQLLQQLLGGAPVAAAAAAAVEPILAGPAQGPVGTAAAASNSRMAAHKLSYVLSSIGNSGGNQGLSMPPGDSSQHAGVSAVSFSSSSTSSTIGSLSSSSSGGNSGSNRASIALQPFIDSAQDVLSYLRYHHSQALLQWLRDFSHQGLPGFYATSADPVNLRAEVERLLNPTRLQQWYQQAASGDRDDKSQQQQWLVVQVRGQHWCIAAAAAAVAVCEYACPCVAQTQDRDRSHVLSTAGRHEQGRPSIARVP